MARQKRRSIARVGASSHELLEHMKSFDGPHRQKTGQRLDSAGVRLVSKTMEEREEHIKADLRSDALFNSQPHKVKAVTLPKFSWGK